MRTARYLSTFVLLGGVACSAAEPPARPSWTEDVEPILRGSCGHCHGATADVTGMKYRFDICDPEVPMIKDLGITFGPLTGAKPLAQIIAASVTSVEGSRPKMPPPPAEPLNDYEFQVISRWASRAENNADSLCNTRRGNQNPRVSVVSAAEKKGDDLVITVDVSDADGETVVGKAQAGVETVNILGPGRHTLRFPGVPEGETVSVTITDGVRTVTRDLD